MKQDYIKAVNDFLMASEKGLNLESYNRNLCRMETRNGDELRKIFRVPDNMVLYGFVKDNFCNVEV